MIYEALTFGADRREPGALGTTGDRMAALGRWVIRQGGAPPVKNHPVNSG